MGFNKTQNAEKVAKKCELLTKSDIKLKFLTFLTAWKSFQFLGKLSCIFFQHILSNFAFYDTHIEFLPINILWVLLALFANFEGKFGRNGSKTKNVFYKCVFEFHFASISGLGGSFCQKKVKSFYPSVHV